MTAQPSGSYEHDDIHEEIHRKHGLLSNRMNWYVTSQAFLFGAAALGGDSPFSRLMSYLGIAVTLAIMASVVGGLLAMWPSAWA